MKNLNKILIGVLVIVVVVAIAISLKPPKKDVPGAKNPEVGVNFTPTPRETAPAGPVVPTPTPRPRNPSIKALVTTPQTGPVPTRTPLPATGIPELESTIFGEDVDLREQALLDLSVLLAQGDENAVKVLEDMIKKGGEDNEEAVMSLMPNLDEAVRPPLLDMALNSPMPEFRAEALSQMRDILFDEDNAKLNESLNDLLIKGLADTDPDVLEEAEDLIVYFDDSPIYKAASVGLMHENQDIRETSLSYLEDMHTINSIEILVREGLNSKYPEIRDGAGDALRFITDAEINTNDPTDWDGWLQSEECTAWINEWDPPKELKTPIGKPGEAPAQ